MQNFDSAAVLLQSPPPPTLRDIIGAYRAKGNGDKELLLAMLNAKAAEDQRLASLASLHKSMLEVYHFERLADLQVGGLGFQQYSLAQSPPPSYGYPNGVHRDRRQQGSPYHPYHNRPHSSPLTNPETLPSPPTPPTWNNKRHRPSKSPPLRSESKREKHQRVEQKSSVSPSQPSPRLISVDRSVHRASTSMAIGSLLREEEDKDVARDSSQSLRSRQPSEEDHSPSPIS